jgi:hypothetical protein
MHRNTNGGDTVADDLVDAALACFRRRVEQERKHVRTILRRFTRGEIETEVCVLGLKACCRRVEFTQVEGDVTVDDDHICIYHEDVLWACYSYKAGDYPIVRDGDHVRKGDAIYIWG